MLLGLATYRAPPTDGADDRFLHAALERRGLRFEQPIWDGEGVDWRRFDSVLVRTTWDYQERLPAFRGWIERVAAVTSLWNPAPVLRWNTHKHYLRDLAASGVRVVPTRWLDRGGAPDLGGFASGLGAAAAVLKPCVGATAREVLRFDVDAAGLAAAQRHVDRLLPNEDLMLQPFVTSVHGRGEGSAMVLDGELVHAVRKVPAAGDYRTQSDFGAADRPLELGAAERALIERAMAVARDLHGDLLYARVDWLWGDDGVPLLSELELVEPVLFFRHAPAAAERLVDGWLRRLR